MPEGADEICRELELLAPACPASVPDSRYGAAGPPIGVDGPYADGGYAVCLRRREGACVSEAFHLEGGVPTGNPARDRPPRFVHVSLHAARGSLDRQFPWLQCKGSAEDEDPEALLTEPRETAVCLGDEVVGERRGTLVLAPPYPSGGEAGGHVAFLWREGGVSYAATLHAWAPVAETREALLRLVASAEMS